MSAWQRETENNVTWSLTIKYSSHNYTNFQVTSTEKIKKFFFILFSYNLFRMINFLQTNCYFFVCFSHLLAFFMTPNYFHVHNFRIPHLIFIRTQKIQKKSGKFSNEREKPESQTKISCFYLFC